MCHWFAEWQVAAALHDNCRALLVGKRTFGKVDVLCKVDLISIFLHSGQASNFLNVGLETRNVVF